MKYKQTQNGKEYVYEYKMVFLKPDTHKRLLKYKRYNHKSINDIVSQLISFYEDQHK